MTEPVGDPARPPSAPQGRPHGPRDGAPGSRSGDAPGAIDSDSRDLGPDVLAPREEALIESSVTALGRSGRGPVIVTALVVGAFLLGLLRPWDLLGPPAAIPPVTPPELVDASPDNGVPGQRPPVARGTGAVPDPTSPPVPRTAITCALPAQWRSSTIEDWTGRQARVWKAVEVVAASGPDDPAIPFEPIVSPTVTAIGWCAPVSGPDRPPQNLTASLYRIRDGTAVQVVYDRLEPDEPDALGELWVPLPRTVGNRPAWALGRYVIELRSTSGGYVRYIGLELLDRVERPSPAP
jgi:hypothetical protein